MESSKTYYGGTFLDGKELAESRFNNRIELEYYTTKTYNRQLNEDKEMYGIEIVKKEYDGKEINLELNHRDGICNSLNKVNEIIDILKKCKVTPIGLDDVMDDIDKRIITE